MSSSRWLIVVLTFVVAFVLNLIPLPGWVLPYRPDWVVLVLIYWCLAIPDRFGTGAGWFVGLLVDVNNANLLGLHALAMAALGYVTSRLHLRIRMFPWWQQSLSVLLLLFFYKGLVGWMRSLLGELQFDWMYWMSSIIGVLIWPWLFIVLRDVRRYARIT